MSLPLWFETVTVNRTNVIVWLRHPYRMISIDMNDLTRCEQKCGGANLIPLQQVPFIEYKSLPAVQDCKMPVLIEMHPNESIITRPCDDYAHNNMSMFFVIEREEYNRIVSSVRSILTLLS